jgi:hypothetical protein
MSNTPEGHDEWTVTDDENHNVRAFSTRASAEDQLEELADLGADVTLHPPDESAEWQYHGDDPKDDDDEDTRADGSGDAVEATPEPVDTTPERQGVPDASVSDLPDDPNLTDDPFAWMPGDFVDEIDGTPTINRRGYAALGRKFGISAPEKTVHVGPEDTDHTYCRVEATVVDDDGREYVNHGSAHVDRGDDPTLLLELATTRARKRALAGATGVGLIAVEELKNEL